MKKSFIKKVFLFVLIIKNNIFASEKQEEIQNLLIGKFTYHSSEKQESKESYLERQESKEPYSERQESKEPYLEKQKSKKPYPDVPDVYEGFDFTFKPTEEDYRNHKIALRAYTPVTRMLPPLFIESEGKTYQIFSHKPKITRLKIRGKSVICTNNQILKADFLNCEGVSFLPDLNERPVLFKQLNLERTSLDKYPLVTVDLQATVKLWAENSSNSGQEDLILENIPEDVSGDDLKISSSFVAPDKLDQDLSASVSEYSDPLIDDFYMINIESLDTDDVMPSPFHTRLGSIAAHIMGPGPVKSIGRGLGYTYSEDVLTPVSQGAEPQTAMGKFASQWIGKEAVLGIGSWLGYEYPKDE